ncbi:MAG TPA: site-specific integrase, partial [Rubricoccaceae bacterium]
VRHPKQKEVTLRTTDPRIARRRLNDLERLESLGQFDPWRQAAPEYGVVVGDAAERYLVSQRRRGRAEATVDRAERTLDQFARSLGGAIAVEQVEPRHVERFVNAPKPDGEPRSSGTKRRYAAVLSHFFKWTVKEGMIRDSPAAGLETPPVRAKVKDFLTDAEEARIVGALTAGAGGSPETTAWAIDWVTFGVRTGLRPGEQAQLRWDAVDLDERTITVGRGFKTKTGHERVVQVRGSAEQVLIRRAGSADGGGDRLVFPGSGGDPSNTDFLTKVLAKAVTSAGVRKTITAYSLRHTYGTRMAAAGTPLYVLAKLMGTSIAMIERHYAHYQPDAGAAYVDRVFG